MRRSKPTPDTSPVRRAAGRDATRLGQTSALPASRRFSESTGRPDSLPAKVEDLSGFALSDVPVRNDRAARPLSAAAHVSPAADLLDEDDYGAGRDRVGHEMAHMVQQRQGRVIRAPDR
jgi:hypothetical protein